MPITFFLLAVLAQANASEIVTVGGEGDHCREDAGCFNRLPPDMEYLASAKVAGLENLS